MSSPTSRFKIVECPNCGAALEEINFLCMPLLRGQQGIYCCPECGTEWDKE